MLLKNMTYLSRFNTNPDISREYDLTEVDPEVLRQIIRENSIRLDQELSELSATASRIAGKIMDKIVIMAAEMIPPRATQKKDFLKLSRRKAAIYYSSNTVISGLDRKRSGKHTFPSPRLI
jgi:hypothetical protein